MIYPEDLAGRAGEGRLGSVFLLEKERWYELIRKEERGLKPHRSIAYMRTTGIGPGGRYELKFVPDGDYILYAYIELDDGEIHMTGTYGGGILTAGAVHGIYGGGGGIIINKNKMGSGFYTNVERTMLGRDNPAFLSVPGRVSLTDVDFDLYRISKVRRKEVTVTGVDVRNGFFYFDDSDGDRVTVSVLPILRGRIFIVDGGLTDLHIFDLDEVGPVVIISGLMVDGEFVAFGVWVSFLPDPPSPADFNGNGIVGLEDFFLFAEVYGSVKGDGIYQAKFDLDQNGSIGLEDFFIFAQSFEY